MHSDGRRDLLWRLDRQDVQHASGLLWASEVRAAVALAGAVVAVDFVALNFDKGGTELEPEVHLCAIGQSSGCA